MKLNPFAMLQEQSDSSAIVYTPYKNKALELNGSGLLIWHLLESEENLDEIVQQLLNHYSNLPEVQARADVNKFIEKLKDNKLLLD